MVTLLPHLRFADVRDIGSQYRDGFLQQGKPPMKAPNRTERRFRVPDLASTLARTSVGNEVLIEDILLPMLRARCRNAGISAGDRVRVEDRSGRTVAIRNGAGRSMLLASAVTVFICTRNAPEQEEPPDVIGKSEARGGSTKWIGMEETARNGGG